jgi:hypothetical protein
MAINYSYVNLASSPHTGGRSNMSLLTKICYKWAYSACVLRAKNHCFIIWWHLCFEIKCMLTKLRYDFHHTVVQHKHTVQWAQISLQSRCNWIINKSRIAVASCEQSALPTVGAYINYKKRGIFSKILPSRGNIKQTIINPEVTLKGAA